MLSFKRGAGLGRRREEGDSRERVCQGEARGGEQRGWDWGLVWRGRRGQITERSRGHVRKLRALGTSEGFYKQGKEEVSMVMCFSSGWRMGEAVCGVRLTHVGTAAVVQERGDGGWMDAGGDSTEKCPLPPRVPDPRKCPSLCLSGGASFLLSACGRPHV